MAQTIGSLDLNAFSDLYSDATQYFWFEGNASATYGAGAHVTLVPDTSFISNPIGQNILMNTDGFSIRNGLLPMMTLDNNSLDFNVVDTTVGTCTNVASFGASSTIGVTDDTQSYMTLDYHSLRMIDKEGDYYLYISDRRGESGSATLEVNFLGDGETTQFDVGVHINTLDSAVDSSDPSNVATISTTNSRYVDFSTAPANGAKVTIVFTTTDQGAKAYTLGTRDTTNDVLGASSVVLNRLNVASGPDSCASGYATVASGNNAHAEGLHTTASGSHSHAEGYYTTASGGCSHAEGCSFDNGDGTKTTNIASRVGSHAEGGGTTASGQCSHAEGVKTIASGHASHAGGYYTTSSGIVSYAEGRETTASGGSSHAEGYRTIASAFCSHAQNNGTIAQRVSQTVIGAYNIADTGGTNETTQGDYVFIIGNGTADDARSNALTVDWDGNVRANGNFYATGHTNPIGWYDAHNNTTTLSNGTSFVKLSNSDITLAAGRYIITGSVRFNGATSGYRGITIRDSDGSIARANVTQQTIPSSSWTTSLNTTIIYIAQSQTTVSLMAYQNSGSSLGISWDIYAICIK